MVSGYETFFALVRYLGRSNSLKTLVVEKDLQRLNIIVIGRVQGVGFRFFVQEQAARLGLRGEVRNDPGERRRLEIVAEGERPALEELLRVVQVGPLGARVADVQIGWEAAQQSFSSFRVTL